MKLSRFLPFMLIGAAMAGALAAGSARAQVPPSPGTAAYYISEFDVTDPEGIKPYSARVESTFAPFGGRYVARGGSVVSLEGEPAKRVVLIAFPTLAQARAWYDSPTYRDLRPVRQRSATSRVFIVDGGAAASPPPAIPGRTMTITASGSQPSIKGAEQTFTGSVRVEPVFPANDPSRVSGGSVTFEPGARSAWHSHPLGQTLVVTAGTGWVQEWNGQKRQIRPGDVVWTPPGVKHWHGATAASGVTHLAFQEALDGKNVEWMEKVSDEQYNDLARPTSSNETPTMTSPEALTRKKLAIGPIAAATATGDMSRLNAALNKGLDAGLTVGEAKEAIVQLYAYAGFPRSLNALGEMMKVIEARKQRGIQDAPGQASSPVPTAQNMLEVGTANQTKLSGAPVSGPLFEFAPAIDQFLKAHLFGDIFARDNLDWPSRELATVAALSAMSGVESQLASHIRISLNVGITAAQLSQIADALASQGAPEASQRLRAALQRQESEPPKQ